MLTTWFSPLNYFRSISNKPTLFPKKQESLTTPSSLPPKRESCRLFPLIVCFLAIFAIPTTANARKPRLRIERVICDPSTPKKLVLFASEVELEGIVRHRANSEFKLIGNNKSPLRPKHAQRFRQTEIPLYITFIVQSSSNFRNLIENNLKTLLEAFRDVRQKNTRFSLIAYDRKPYIIAKHLQIDALIQSSRRMLLSEKDIDRDLISALRLAIKHLNKQSTSTSNRKIIVAISDGNDSYPDWNRFRQLGDFAKKHNIAIYSVAYSPDDQRGPLLNLGELSKRSHGYLRWVKKESDFQNQMKNLVEEINETKVFQFSDPNNCSNSMMLQLSAGGLISKPFKFSDKNQIAKDHSKKQEADKRLNRSRRLTWKFWLAMLAIILLGLILLGGSLLFFFRSEKGRSLEINEDESGPADLKEALKRKEKRE